jgi:ABC-type sugar transport system ATPase subunit
MKNNNDILLRMKNISKSFGSVQALKNVDFTLKRGEVHGLVGENGAGKTTLMNILHGIEANDSGTIQINSHEFKQMSTSTAKKMGIAVIPQKIQLFFELSIAENLFINNWPINKKSHAINWSEMKSKTREILEKVDLNIDPLRKVSTLSYIEQQMIEIAKGFFVEKAEILILDEPTSPLVIHEIKILFNLIETLKKKGLSFIYISHYLDEVFKICDRVTVLRDGQVVSVADIKSIDMKTLIKMMVGEGINIYPNRKSNIGEDILEVKKFIRKPMLNGVNFTVKRGEILGIAGLKGSGRTELARSLCGLDRYDEGEIVYKGKKIKINSTRKGLDNGIGYLTEDRIKWGLFSIRSVIENTTITFLKKIINKAGFIKIKEEKDIVQSYRDKLNIKIASTNQQVKYLSGGNQQKVIIAKLLGSDLDIFIFDEPTFGIDVKAKMYIHEIMNMLVEEGKSIILISSDVMELVRMSDRIIILKEGKIQKELLQDSINESKIISILEGAAG